MLKYCYKRYIAFGSSCIIYYSYIALHQMRSPASVRILHCGMHDAMAYTDRLVARSDRLVGRFRFSWRVQPEVPSRTLARDW
jgi:hypothetical protein